MAFIEPMHRNKPYITYLFTVHGSTTDHLVSLERYVRDAFARKQQAVGLFFDFPTKCCYFVIVGGLRFSQIPEAMSAGVLTPGRFNHAGQALEERPD